MSAEDRSGAEFGGDGAQAAVSVSRTARRNDRNRGRIYRRWLVISAVLIGVVICSAVLWMAYRTMEVKHHLSSAVSLIPQIKVQIYAGNGGEARNLLGQVQDHTQAARDAVDDPLWKVSSRMPFFGQNFDAVSGVTLAADSVITGVGGPLLGTYDLFASGAAAPKDGVLDVAQLREASSGIASASLTTKRALSQLEAIDKRNLLPEISEPLDEVTRMLQDASGPLNAAAELSGLLPSMLGSDEPRNYLVLVQNNAEIRATGGLPGALAVVRIDKGKIELTAQVSGKELGKFVPRIGVDPEQERIYTTRLGAFISDVNLTPDFPTVAQTAKAMWETRYGTPIDGVVAIDPIVLSHVLKVSGPLPLPEAHGSNLPSSITADNVVKTLLADVYVTMSNGNQDQFFASAARQVFEAIASGKAPVMPLIQALAQSTGENRLHAWSQRDAEQHMLVSTKLGGSASAGPDAGSDSFGAFFNDATGAKMDYYVRRTVQLVKECAKDGYEETSVRVTSTNTAPADAATSLPAYVTGGGIYGVSPGSVQTNIVAYGPVQTNMETAKLDGQRIDFAAHLHSNRPVGVLAVKLAPGETKTAEFTFGKIVQNSEPNLVVTPTVQDVNDVILPTQIAQCG